MPPGKGVNLLDVLDELLQLPSEQRLTRIQELGLPEQDVARLQSCLREDGVADRAMDDAAPLVVEAMQLLENRSSDSPSANADPSSKQVIESLLNAVDASIGSVLPREASAGARIGRYKLLQQIGEGGFGVVFMAEQEHPVRRTVALKIIKSGMDTEQVVARFQTERQVLALMDHPNIAKVLDAGSTERGRPYFVMELVRGSPLTDYCDHHQLNTRQRLNLFVQVCQAVQHAHQKGIIHRDLKPTNVLVTVADDGRPVPKVIDFGIAKATAGQELTDRKIVTEFRQFIGTPLYMSPEQMESDTIADVDTRSDVYALGVLLYELLTGTTPFEKDRLLKAAYDDVLRIIRDEEPPRPSMRLSTIGVPLQEIAMRRRLDAKQLGALLRGELDWIVMRGMEKDRARRYQTAIELAHDLERYLADQPVEACPPSRAYRFRKFARRNKAAIAMGAVIATVLILATGVSSWQALRATTEKRRADEQAAVANAVSDFLKHDLLRQASVKHQSLREFAPDRDLKVRDALNRAAAGVDRRFPNQPLVEAAIRYTIGDAYLDLGEYVEAERHLSAAMRLRQQTVGDTHSDTLACVNSLGVLYKRQGQHAKAETLLNQLLQARRKTLGERDSATLEALSDLGSVYFEQRQNEKAITTLRQALNGQRDVLGGDHIATLATTSNLSLAYSRQGQHAEAESLLLTALDGARRSLGALHPQTLTMTGNLAIVYQAQGRSDDAAAILLKSLDAKRQVLGQRHPETLITMMSLGVFYSKQGRHDEAEPLLLSGLSELRRLYGDQRPETLYALTALADEYQSRRAFDKAEPLLKQALDGHLKVYGQHHPLTLNTVNSLGAVYYCKGQSDKVKALLAPVLTGLRQVPRDPEQKIAEMMYLLGRAYLDQNKHAEAQPLLLQAWEDCRKLHGDRHPDTIQARTALAKCYSASGDHVRAEQLK
jgi:serine/threonine protein kinase